MLWVCPALKFNFQLNEPHSLTTLLESHLDCLVKEKLYVFLEAMLGKPTISQIIIF